MMVIRYLRMILLSLYWQLPRAEAAQFQAPTEITRDLNKKKVQKKLPKTKRHKLPPIERKRVGHQGYKNGKSKDARYSNQLRLRRMYRSS